MTKGREAEEMTAQSGITQGLKTQEVNQGRVKPIINHKRRECKERQEGESKHET